jgi:alginate O-acetyltransferase complex protein AlgI
MAALQIAPAQQHVRMVWIARPVLSSRPYGTGVLTRTSCRRTAMLFNDPHFLFVFLPLTLAAYVTAQRLGGARAVLATLVLASLIFYGAWKPLYLPLLAGMAVFTFLIARRITAARRRGAIRACRALLAVGVTVDLLVLAYFKYADFVIGTANLALRTDVPFQHIILPLGISFFTFQKVAYLVDTSRGEVEDHDFLEYCFFVMFFPQLIAGPIVHHHEIFSQLRGRDAFAVHRLNLMIGLSIFLIGLFKKVVIADRLAPLASGPFTAAAHGPVFLAAAWQGAFAYAFQLYFDFSGYSDMAIGAARLFGIRLPLNFESPYQATSIIEFWRRWHMTLSRFLRDYLYIPLGGNRHGLARRYLNLMLTMTIGGLWHGAAWTFVLWGFLHGTYLVINHAWRGVWTPIDTWWSRALARLVTLLAVVVAFVTFRAPSFNVALAMYRGMTTLPAPLAAPLGGVADALRWLGVSFAGPPFETDDLRLVAWAVTWIAVVWFVPNTQQLMSGVRPAINYDRSSYRRDPPLVVAFRSLRALRWRPALPHAAWIGILAALAFLSLQHVSEFLYFEF